MALNKNTDLYLYKIYINQEVNLCIKTTSILYTYLLIIYLLHYTQNISYNYFQVFLVINVFLKIQRQFIIVISSKILECNTPTSYITSSAVQKTNFF